MVDARRIAQKALELGPRRTAQAAGQRAASRARLALARRHPPLSTDDPIIATTDRAHYGCGKNILPGWLNIDGYAASYPGGGAGSEVAQVHRVELTGRHPFPDNHLRFGYAEDFIEHLTQAGSIAFLAEAHRTLQPGGVLRLSFPGLVGVMDKHFRGSGFEAAELVRTEAYTMWDHHHFYCLESLQVVAGAIGFATVTEVEYGQSTHSELRGLETREDQIGLNLNVELVA